VWWSQDANRQCGSVSGQKNKGEQKNLIGKTAKPVVIRRVQLSGSNRLIVKIEEEMSPSHHWTFFKHGFQKNWSLL